MGAVVEGRALLASTPPPGVSPRCGRAAVQWHRRCCPHGGIALPQYRAAGPKRKMPGVRGQSPRALDSARPDGVQRPDELHIRDLV